MVNSLWLYIFSDCEINFLSPEFSDHCAGLLINKSQVPRTNKPFKFFNYLIKNGSFLSVIQNAWFASNAYGTIMFQLSKRLKSLKPVIRAFSKTHYQGIHAKVEEARAKLQR